MSAEVEIDPQTGDTEVLRYTVVDDFGVTLNPLLLAGQVHGGVVQGLGQALHERTVYDAGRAARDRLLHGLPSAPGRRHSGHPFRDAQRALDDEHFWA
jgi:CO/xanthine dehydrogenase Mo-binding subunit